MRDPEIIVLACIAASVAGTLGVDAVGFGHGVRVLGFPAFVGLAIVLLCGLRAWHRRSEPGRAAERVPTSTGVRRTTGAGLGFLAVLPVVLVFGLVLGLPLFVMAYLRLRGEGWRVAAAGAAITLAGAALFVLVFGVSQPKGPLAWP